MKEATSEILSLKEKAEKFLASIPEGKRHMHWPKELRKEAIAAIQAGIKLTKVSSETGISHHTLRRWLKTNNSIKSKGRFCQVKMKGENPLRVISKNGFEVQGLSFTELQALFERKFL